MGTQKRYAADRTALRERAVAWRAKAIEDAAAKIDAHHAAGGRPDAVYGGHGTCYGHPDQSGWELSLIDGQYLRQATRADGADGRLLVTSADSTESVLERVYVVHGCESPRELRRRRISDCLFAGIGIGKLEAVPTSRVQDLAGHWLAVAGDDGRLMARHCEGLRQAIGLPTGPWGDSAFDASVRGRRIAAALEAQKEPPARQEPVPKWGLRS